MIVFYARNKVQVVKNSNYPLMRKILFGKNHQASHNIFMFINIRGNPLKHWPVGSIETPLEGKRTVLSPDFDLPFNHILLFSTNLYTGTQSYDQRKPVQVPSQTYSVFTNTFRSQNPILYLVWIAINCSKKQQKLIHTFPLGVNWHRTQKISDLLTVSVK